MKSENELPVAVVVVDTHGLVTALRITPAGDAFFRQVTVSKGPLRAREEEWPPEWRNDVKTIRRKVRLFLDETSEDMVSTYCRKGHHQVEIPIGELRLRAAAFKAGERTTTLDLS